MTGWAGLMLGGEPAVELSVSLVEAATGSTSITVPSGGGVVQVHLVVSSPVGLVDFYGVPEIDQPNVVRLEGMQWLGPTGGTPVSQSTGGTRLD